MTAMLLMFWVNVSQAGPTLGVVVMPTRDASQKLQKRSLEVGHAAARLMAGSVVKETPHSKVDAAMTRSLGKAQELASAGALDEAAATFDLALAHWSRNPQNIDGGILLSAMLERTTIALARKEEDLAVSLLSQALRYNPGLSLRPSERRPSMQEAMSQAKVQDLSLRPVDLGQACQAGAEILIVSRETETGIEFLRFDRCSLTRTVHSRQSDSSDTLAHLLVDDLLAPANKKPSAQPLYKRTTFWVIVGVTTVALAGTVYLLQDDKKELEIVPHF